ncbi:Eukaryotic peptide chain release factor GTP-binding subunit ERF3B [Bienertia sinuspersici]
MESSHLYEIIHDTHEDDFGAILCRVAARGEGEDLINFTSLARACWFCRNKTVHEDQPFVPTMVAAGFLGKWGRGSRQPLVQESTRGGVIKINTDAAVVEAVGVGLGVAARDARGELLCMAARTAAATWDPNVAEAAATWMGVELAVRMGWKRIWLEMDALNIVIKISKAVKNLARYLLLSIEF